MIPATVAADLDTLVDLLGTLTTGTGEAMKPAYIQLTLRDGTPIDIWQSTNDPGFKWTPGKTTP